MSLLGFDRLIARQRLAETLFLRKGMTAAQEEFKHNFKTESNAETGEQWEMVQRKVPPPILFEIGSLMNEATNVFNVVLGEGKIVLTVDPIDKNGKGYASFHQDGIGQNPERAFITQSEKLTRIQEAILDRVMTNFFNHEFNYQGERRAWMGTSHLYNP